MTPVSGSCSSQSRCDPRSLTSCSSRPGAGPFRLNRGDPYNPENTAEVTVCDLHGHVRKGTATPGSSLTRLPPRCEDTQAAPGRRARGGTTGQPYSAATGAQTYQVTHHYVSPLGQFEQSARSLTILRTPHCYARPSPKLTSGCLSRPYSLGVYVHVYVPKKGLGRATTGVSLTKHQS